jgi:predicted transcriptional regulator of viral defense system
MAMDFKDAVQKYEEAPLTRQIMMDLLRGYQRPYDKINELVKKGQLTPIKNGLYIPGPNTKTLKPAPFLVANHLRGPSYVSLDAALSFWGLIPERVYEITSVTTKTGKTYSTPLGKFSYFRAPLPYYAFGIKSVALTARQVVLMASAEKALCDKIVMTSGIWLRSVKQAREILLDDLRIEEEQLKELDANEILSWIDNAPKKNSLTLLVKMLINL